MATYTQAQYSVGSSYYNYFLSRVDPGQDYLIFATSSQYIGIVGKYVDGHFEDSTVYSISRSNSGGNVASVSESRTNFTLSYDYYVYSSIGKGTELVTPAQNQLQIYSQSFSAVLLCFLLLFTVGFSIIKKRWLSL